jgi:carbon monoxide dehydrogenase subunit G
MVYKGSGTFTECDESARRVVISADGRDSRGQGTAQATVTTSLRDEGGSTRVTVGSDLKVTGKVAEFGRGVMNDVAGKILTQFADCLAGNLS